jgi:hypothetical protein
MSEEHLKGPMGREIRFNESEYPFWSSHFDEETKSAMIKEDLTAGEFVSAELFIIVFIGVALGVVGVLAAFWS